MLTLFYIAFHKKHTLFSWNYLFGSGWEFSQPAGSRAIGLARKAWVFGLFGFRAEPDPTLVWPKGSGFYDLKRLIFIAFLCDNFPKIGNFPQFLPTLSLSFLCRYYLHATLIKTEWGKVEIFPRVLPFDFYLFFSFIYQFYVKTC